MNIFTEQFWLLFALLAPMLWALTNILDGALRKNFVKNNFALTWIFALSRLPFAILFFMVAGVHIPSTTSVIMMFLGGVFWTLPVILYFKALEKEEPSRVSLLMQFVPVFTLILASIFLGESLTSTQAIAFVILILGGALASVKKMNGKWHWSSAFILIMLATFLWATSDILFKKFEVEFESFMAGFAIYFLGSFIFSLVSLAHPKGRKNVMKYFTKLPAKAWWMIKASLLAGIGGSVAFAYALTLGKASLTSVLIGTQPLFVLVIGLILACFIKGVEKETLSKNALLLKSASFALILTGLVLLSF